MSLAQILPRSLRRVARDMNKDLMPLVHDPFRMASGMFPFMQAETPRSDIYETKDAIVMETEIPGATDIDVQVVGDDRLVIRGKWGGSVKEGDDAKKYFSVERVEGEFERDVVVPTKFDPNDVKATAHNGILTVKAKKVLTGDLDAERVKKVEVKHE